MKTALQELIEEMQSGGETFILDKEQILKTIQNYLPQEREQIESAYSIGRMNGYHEDDTSASDYYNKTYGE